MQWKNAQSTYFLGCNASFKCPFLLRLVGFAASGGWWVGSRQSCRLSVMKNDNRTWNLFPMKTDYHVLNLVLTTEKVQGKMPLGGSILKIRGLSWGNSSWAWPHGLGMSPHTHGLCPSYSTEDKVIVNLNIHRWQGEGGWEGFLHPILKSGEILSLYGSKISL